LSNVPFNCVLLFLFQASSQPLSPHPISPAPSPLSPLSPGSGVDFSTPPQLTSLLDNSAARHRMSLKPKNQRASAKNKRVITSVSIFLWPFLNQLSIFVKRCCSDHVF